MKNTKIIALLLAATLLLSCVLLTGCTTQQEQYEVPSYQGLLKEGQSKSDFNKELFYRNDQFIDDSPDPFVFDNTERDGYYYLYATKGDLFCSRSKDLMNWEPVGNTLDIQDYENGQVTEIRRTVWKDIWAPEVVYDEDDGKYYMFFSATPAEDENVTTGEGAMYGTAYTLFVITIDLSLRLRRKALSSSPMR